MIKNHADHQYQSISTQTLDQDQETHQLSQVEVEDTQPTYKKIFRISTQVSDKQLNRQANELVSGQKKDTFSTQLAPRQKISILNYIRLDEVRKFNKIEKPIEKVIHVHEVCKFDDDSLYLDDLFRDVWLHIHPQGES